MQGACFCIHSASLCLLLGAFNPFTFKVIIDKYDPIAIYVVVFGSEFIYLFCVSYLEKILYHLLKSCLVVLNSVSFCLSVKLLISPSYLNEILAGYSNLVVGFSLSSL